MRALHHIQPAPPQGFTGDLHARLEVVHDRVGAESGHLDQVAAVAASYAEPLPPPLKLLR
jgi:hypothetical protein